MQAINKYRCTETATRSFPYHDRGERSYCETHCDTYFAINKKMRNPILKSFWKPSLPGNMCDWDFNKGY